MKLEWATVKDGRLVLGSFGKEYTAPGAFIVCIYICIFMCYIPTTITRSI